MCHSGCTGSSILGFSLKLDNDPAPLAASRLCPFPNMFLPLLDGCSLALSKPGKLSLLILPVLETGKSSSTWASRDEQSRHLHLQLCSIPSQGSKSLAKTETTSFIRLGEESEFPSENLSRRHSAGRGENLISYNLSLSFD